MREREHLRALAEREKTMFEEVYEWLLRGWGTDVEESEN